MHQAEFDYLFIYIILDKISLMMFSVKFTEKGYIELKITHAKPTESTTRNDKLILQIEITDTGIGIPAALIDQV